jgi:hypothetical protein
VKRRDFIRASAGFGAFAVPLLSRASEPCPPPQVGVSGGATVSTACPVATAPDPGGSGSYTTAFPLTENPISEGGRWRNTGVDWTAVRTTPGLAFGTNGAANGYDDSYAYLSGFGANHTVEATIYAADNIDSSESHEVELLLRWSDAPHSARGYECLLSFLGSIQIVRWNGALGDFTGLAGGGTGGRVKTGDVFKASISGNTINVYYNGQLKCSATDSTYSSGNPGMAFFKRTTGQNNVFGLSRYTAKTT